MPDLVSLNAAIDSYAEQSYGSDVDGGELSRQRSLALDAFQGKVIDVAPEGTSQVQDWAVFETCMWIMPSLMRIFAGGENIVEFDPVGPDDEEIAEQESDVLNHLVTQKGDWDLVARTWCQDALVTKNAYCLAYMEEKLSPEVIRYEGQSEEQVAMLLEGDVEVVGQAQYNDPNDEGTLLHPMSGQPVEDEQQALEALIVYEMEGVEPELQYKQLYDIEIREVKAKKNLRFRVLPPEHCKVGEDTPSFQVDDDTNYFEFWDKVTISDLRKEGYDIDDEIGFSDTGDSMEEESRDELYDMDMDVEHTDKAMRQVIVRYVWIRHDYDEDGIAELLQVVRVGNELISKEGEDAVQMVSTIPVASIVPFINTHRHVGMSVADLIFDVQRIKTAMLRSGLNSLYLATNPGHVVSDKVTLDDMLTSRPGRLVRLKSGAIPGEGHVMPMQTENTFPYAQQGLLHMDSVIESRVGVSRAFTGIDAGSMVGSNDYNAIGQLSSMAAQRVEDIARLFGSGFKRLFSIAHELLIKSGHQGETMKIRGQWVDVDPTQWKTGRDMRITAPFAAGNKDSLVQRLMIHMQVHEKALAAGLPIVDASDAYELALLLAQATDVPGSKIYTDPTTIEPKEPGPDYTMLALQIEDKKAENAAKDSEIDAQVKVKEIDTDAQVKELIARINSETQIALAQLKEGQAINLEQLRAQLKEAPLELGNALDETKMVQEAVNRAVAEMQEAMAKADEQAMAPIKIVRDEKGKITGKEVNGKFVPLEDV